MRWQLPIVLQCWQGSGVDMGTGPPADVGREAMRRRPDVFYFQPVGNWTAGMPPYMGVGVTDGYNEGIRLAEKVHPNNYIIPIGYSIGAVIGARFWRDYILKTGQADRIPAGIMFGPPMRCFPPGTLIRMANGSQTAIEDILPGEWVVTAEGKPGRVTHTASREEANGLIQLKVWGHSHLLTTAEHPVLTRRGYVRADALLPGDQIAFPKYLSEKRTVIRTADYATQHQNARGYGNNYKPMPEKITLDAQFGRLIGLYLAEGSSQHSRRHGGNARWDFHEDEVDSLAADVVSTLRGYGVEPRIRMTPAKKGCQVIAYSVGWAQLFAALCGTGAAEKCPHPDLTDGPREFLEGMLNGWFDGDGHTRRGGRTGTTVSHRLAMAMYDIAQGLGLHPAITKRQRPDRLLSWEVGISRAEVAADVDEWEQRWLNSRNVSGVPGVSYHHAYRGSKKWRATLQVNGQCLELGHFSTPDEAATVIRTKREALFADGAHTDRRGRTRICEDERHVWRRLRATEAQPYIGPVYDLSIEGDHSYIAEGIGVHNCPGKANGNRYAGWEMPRPDHGGIAGPGDLRPEETPDTWLDFVQMGKDHGETELYGNCKTGPSPWPPGQEDEEGAAETSIYEDAIAPNAWTGFVKFLQILMHAGHPIGTAKAIWVGGAFLAAGLNADHYSYPTEAAVRYLTDVIAPRYK